MATTIGELTDLITSQQREINDIEVKIVSQDQIISDHDTEINTLQHPAAGVPPELLDWLTTHSIREVDSILDTDLNDLSSTVTSNTDAIGALTSTLNDEAASRIEIDTTLNDTDIDLQTQITTNLDALNQEVTDRSTLAVTVSDGFDTVNTRVDTLQSDMDAATSTAATSSVSMSSQIASLSASLQTANTQILLLSGTGVDPLGAQAAQITALTTIANDADTKVNQEILDRKSADVTLQASLTSLSASITGLNTSMGNETTDRKQADLDLQSDIDSLVGRVGGHDGLITSETAARTAADATLTTNVAANTDDIGILSGNLTDESTTRTDADTALQASIATHDSLITTQSSEIATNTADIAQVKGQYGVVRDGSGYVTQWQINDNSTAAGNFNIRYLNNDVKLRNPSYLGQYFPAISSLSFSLPEPFDAAWGGATSSDFQGGDTNSYTRQVKVYATQTAAYNGSCFFGTANGTGGSAFRLGQAVTTFNVDFSGYANRYLSLWYRIKNTTGSLTDRWFPIAMSDNIAPGAPTYGYVRQQATVQINVPVDKVIEFGLTVLNTFDTTIADPFNDLVYGGSVSVSACNLITVT